MLSSGSRRLLAGLILSLLALLVPSTAQAGRMIVTGHDADLHCAYGGTPNVNGDHCHYVQVAVQYARGQAPDPSKKVLLIDCSTTLETALGYAFNGAPPAFDRVCPTDAGWAMQALDTNTYSAMLVATSIYVGSAGSAALNSRKSDIETFFNQGGGIFANTGATIPTYYGFLPLSVDSGVNTAPYSLTPAGQQIGLQDSTNGIGTYNDINCCPTHNSFAEPAPGSPILVAERDANEKPITLIAEGLISGGTIVEEAVEADTALDSTPPALSSVTTAEFEFSSPTSGVTFECRLDEGEWSTCESPHFVNQLDDGSHDFAVRAVNGSVKDATPATYSWMIDSAAPGAPVLGTPPASPTAATSATISWTPSETGGHFSCAVDGAEPVDCESPLVLTGLGDGEHVVKVRHIDAAGNVSDPAVVSWTVDTVAPGAPHVDSAPGELTHSTSATIAWTGENGGRFTCAIDGADPVDCESPLVLDGLADGDHVVKVRQIDAAGNVGDPATVAWIIDTVPPGAPVLVQTDEAPGLVTTPAAATISWTGEEGGRFTCEIDGAEPVPCESPLILTGLADGEHVVKVRQLDAAGNASDPVAVRWTKHKHTSIAGGGSTSGPAPSGPTPSPVAPGPVHTTPGSDVAPTSRAARPQLAATLLGEGAPARWARITVGARHGLAVGCALDHGRLESCRVRVLLAGPGARAAEVMGSGQVTSAGGSAVVRVRLRRTLARMVGASRSGVKVRVIVTATSPASAGRLRVARRVLLLPGA